MEINDLKGKTLLGYEFKHSGCDNTHIFYFENGVILEFFHEDCEGDIRVYTK